MRQTSLDAYWGEVSPQLKTLQREVLDVLKRIGPATDLELEAAMPQRRGSTVRGRRAELVRLGMVEPCGRGGDGKRYLWKAVS